MMKISLLAMAIFLTSNVFAQKKSLSNLDRYLDYLKASPLSFGILADSYVSNTVSEVDTLNKGKVEGGYYDNVTTDVLFMFNYKLTDKYDVRFQPIVNKTWDGENKSGTETRQDMTLDSIEYRFRVKDFFGKKFYFKSTFENRLSQTTDKNDRGNNEGNNQFRLTLLRSFAPKWTTSFQGRYYHYFVNHRRLNNKRHRARAYFNNSYAFNDNFSLGTTIRFQHEEFIGGDDDDSVMIEVAPDFVLSDVLSLGFYFDWHIKKADGEDGTSNLAPENLDIGMVLVYSVF